jgi:hypothetical protein
MSCFELGNCSEARDQSIDLFLDAFGKDLMKRLRHLLDCLICKLERFCPLSAHAEKHDFLGPAQKAHLII